MIRSRVIATLCLVLVATPVLAEQLVGVGSPFWAMRVSLDTDTDCVPATGGSTCALFVASEIKSWRDSHVLVVTSTSNTRCCFSGDPSLDLTADALALTDAGGPNGSGPCAGFSLIPTAGTGRRDLRPARSDVNARSGARTGLCS